jgi:hypothetical protein
MIPLSTSHIGIFGCTVHLFRYKEPIKIITIGNMANIINTINSDITNNNRVQKILAQVGEL